MDQFLELTQPSPLSITTLVINLLLGAMFAHILSWHYIRFGKTYSNRAEMAQVFPLVIMATLLIISVVKSSLALSLGLVGALSIVRFRTPIKEPEELSYLLFAIAMGLGFGADQRIPTIVASVTIMIILGLLRRFPGVNKKSQHNLYLNVEVPQEKGVDSVLEQIHHIVTTHANQTDMRRIDSRNGLLQATYYIDCRNSNTLITLMDSLQTSLPKAAVSFVEQKGILGA